MKKKRGQAIVVLAVTLTAIIALMALMIDTGRILIEHDKLRRAVDSASLASVLDLPHQTQARENGTTAAKANIQAPNDFDPDSGTYNQDGSNLWNEVEFDLDFFGARYVDGELQVDTSYAVMKKEVPTRFGNFLGRDSWTISAESAARIGPIEEIKYWIPIGIEETDDIKLYEHYRLMNTKHDKAGPSDIKLKYVPIQGYDMKWDTRDDIDQKLKVGDTLTRNTSNVWEEQFCEGVDERIKKDNPNVTGCFKVQGNINPDELNFVGREYRKNYTFGDDDRLVYVPFVKQTTGGDFFNGSQYEVDGFGLFYIEYAHYDTSAMGSGQELTELVGFFVRHVVEGPVGEGPMIYGVVGVEYLDVEKIDSLYPAN